MSPERFRECLRLLEADYPNWDAPAKRFEKAYRRTPYTILISTLLSFQTRDEVTLEAGKRLFALADTPEAMLGLSEEEIARTIYPVGFWRKKAAGILEVTRTLLERHGGEVPSTLSELTAIKGIGPKTAKIVLENAYGQSVAAVDTHVHRILNLLGVVETASPEATDKALEGLLEPGELKGLNKLLVSFGQAICRPRNPLCSRCPIRSCCPKAPGKSWI
ncbi:endonuclease III domain-containing protein [Nitratifractor salsuginis]|uniref:DNA-(Apurinic or apyrimidinic site) lyase n=1 Tax=Nitratifractor salsuginis (strain DSM 16511 / JCM 12458 / E9I37-1) TaxID=749222 RepID=E6X348_NITSE|nr:endonuclease III [Nitratifractor salsuginis]ADV46192.1 DNA-(apurinic or apyrimidinic site) lyase [Nitratifractor salsuginis DSM 16511]